MTERAGGLSLSELLESIHPDPQTLADGRRRMVDIWNGRPTDSLPILFNAPPPHNAVLTSDLHHHVEDNGQMLYDTAVGLVAASRAMSDAQLGVRADTGTGTLATIAGCQLIPSEFALPWTMHLTRDALEAFDPRGDLAERGIMPRVQALYAFFRAHLPGGIDYFCADTQGPFALAHLLYGDALLYDVYDDPSFVHALLEKTTALYIAGTQLMKCWIGEQPESGTHGAMALANGGVRLCEDTSTLLAPEMIETFVLPYQQRALAPFGGGFIHYCGNNEALYHGCLRNPLVRGLNLGNPERHDFSRIIPELLTAGKCYAGTINRRSEEAMSDYFRRVIGYTAGARTGLIFMAELHPEETVDPARVLDCWRNLQ